MVWVKWVKLWRGKFLSVDYLATNPYRELEPLHFKGKWREFGSLSFSLCIFSYPFYFSLLFLLALTHAALSPHTLGLHSFSIFFKWPNGLSLLFLSPFLLFTLFTSSHNKCKLRLCFNQFLFFNTPLAKWPCQLLLLSFLSSFSVSNTPKPTNPCLLLYIMKKS